MHRYGRPYEMELPRCFFSRSSRLEAGPSPHTSGRDLSATGWFVEAWEGRREKKKKEGGNRSTPGMPHVQTPEESQAPTSMILVGLAFRHARDSRRARRQKQAARKRKGSVCLDQLARAAEYRVPHSQRIKMHVGDWALCGRLRMKCLSDRQVPRWRTCPDGTAWSPQLAGGVAP